MISSDRDKQEPNRNSWYMTAGHVNCLPDARQTASMHGGESRSTRPQLDIK